jgi:hypothetical protein
MTVIMPPSSGDLNTVRALLELASDPKAMKQALGELRDRINELALKRDAAQAAQRAAADAEQRAQNIARELETRAARLDSREKALDAREAAVATREAKLEALRRQVA